MKPSFFYIALLITLLSCRKEPDPVWWGPGNALKNGKEWTAKASASLQPAWKDSFIIVGMRHYTADIFDEDLGFLKVPTQPGKYDLITYNIDRIYPHPGADHYTLIGGDQIGDLFALDTLYPDNYVEVLKYDTVNHFIDIRFSCRFIISERRTSISPDTVVFTNGTASAKIN